MKAVLLAAGRSTRTWPLSRDIPKPLLPILGMPIIGYTISGLRSLVSEWYVVVGNGADQVESYLWEQFPQTTFHFVQDIMEGTGSALMQVRPYLDKESFLVLNADDLYHPDDIAALITSPESSAGLAKTVSDPRRFGIYIMEGDRPVGLVEKPQSGGGTYANAGAYKFHTDIFAHTLTRSPRGEYEIVDYINYLFAQHAEFALAEVKGYWLPVTYPWDVLVAQRYFLSRADVAYRVDPSAEVDGSVYLGKNVYIGKGCRVGAEVELENVCLMEGVTVGDYVRLHDTVMAPGSMVSPDTLVTAHPGDHLLPIAGKEPQLVSPQFSGAFVASGETLAGFVDGPIFIG